MSTVNSNIQIGKKDAAFFAANPTLVLLDGQLIYNEDTLELFIGDGTTQLSALSAINSGFTPSGTNLQYIRGDGSLATFPTNVSSFTNDAGYLDNGDIGVTVQGYSANTTLLGNTTTGSGSIVLATSPTINTPSFTGFTSFTSTGTPSSGEPNYFISTISNITGNQYNIRSTYNVESTVNNNYRIGGLLGETYIKAGNSGDLGYAVGTYGYIQNYGTGTVTRAIGSYNIVANRGGASVIDNAYGGYFKIENDSGTINTINSVRILTPSNAGTITSNTGLYIEDQSSIGTSSNYSIYSAGSNSLAYFEGSMTVSNPLTASNSLNVPNIIGTTVSGISYKATTGNPTSTDTAHLFLGGNNGATEIIRFINNGNIVIPNNRVIQGRDSAGTLRTLIGWSAGDNIEIRGRIGTTDITINPSSGTGLIIKSNGTIGLGVATPTAKVHLQAGAASGANAPLKFTSGTNQTTAEAGTVEYNGRFFMTESDAIRRNIVLAASTTKTTAAAPYTNDGYIEVQINGTTFKLMTTA